MIRGVCFEIACSKLDGFDGFYCAVDKMNNKVEKRLMKCSKKVGVIKMLVYMLQIYHVPILSVNSACLLHKMHLKTQLCFYCIIITYYVHAPIVMFYFCFRRRVVKVNVRVSGTIRGEAEGEGNFFHFFTT